MTRFNGKSLIALYSVTSALYLLGNTGGARRLVRRAVSVLFGPCWAIYAGTLDTVDNEHTEMAGAVS